MCRVTHSNPASIRPVTLPFKDVLQDAVSLPIPATKRTVQESNMKKRKDTKPILRKSSYTILKPAMKRTKNFSFIPALVFAEDEEETSTLSRESSMVSFRSDLEEEEEELVSSTQKESPKPRIAFSNRVLVQEFYRTPGEKERTWYTSDQLQSFREEALELVYEYNRTHWRSIFLNKPKPTVHGHPALKPPEDDDATDLKDTPTIQNQIKRVLIVDSHDLCLKLFNKSVQAAFPHTIIHTATTSQEALYLCQGNLCFDIMLVEQRLSLFHRQSESGSSLLRDLEQTQCQPDCLCIGVTAHLDHDEANLIESGADFCWSKPPPALNEATVEELFQALLAKRGKSLVRKKHSIASRVFLKPILS